MRRAGINPQIQTPGGRVLRQMGSGITSTGLSRKNRDKMYIIINDVEDYQHKLIQDQEQVARFFQERYKKEWDNLHFKLISFEPPAIKELATGQDLALGAE